MLEFGDFFLDNKRMKEKSKKSESKKVNLKKALPFAGIALVLLVGGVCAFSLFSKKEAVIAFYGIAEPQAKGIQSVLDEISESENLHYKYVIYDPSKKLSSQIPLSNKPKIVFTTSGYAVESAVEKADKKAGVSPELLAPLTSSLKGGAKFSPAGDKVLAYPILSSHLEVDVETTAFGNSGVKEINTWGDIETFIKTQLKKTPNPIAFAGKDPNTVLDIAGAFAESLDGEESYREAVSIIKANAKKFDAIRTAKALCDEPNSPLATTIRQLSAWYKLGYIHPGTFSFTITDVEAFAESRISTVLFMSLDEHRNMKNETIRRYSSTYYLSERGGNERVFNGKIIYAVPLTDSAENTRLLTALASVKSEEELSRKTGLAPAFAQCRTPDSQATYARWWIASTKTPLPGLSSEIYLTPQQKTQLAAELAARIRTGK